MKKICAKLFATLCLGSAAGGAFAQWQKTPEVQALYEAARKEGEVVVWGNAAREVDWLPKAFSEAFPGIQVKVMADDNITTKAIAEARAGRHSVDVISTSLSLVLQLDERKLLRKTDWQTFGVPATHSALDGRMGYTYNILYTLVYNKNRVKPEDLPKSWADLLDAKYKGKVVANQFLLPRMVGALALTWGEEKTVQFARDLRANADIMLTNAPREPFLQSGERLYAAGEIDSFPKLWARDGIPVDYVIPEPVVTAQIGVVVLDKAPHASAARLMAGWMASAEGRRVRERNTFQVDYTPGSDNPTARKIYASGAKVVLDTPEQVTQRDALMRRIAPIVSGQAR